VAKVRSVLQPYRKYIDRLAAVGTYIFILALAVGAFLDSSSQGISGRETLMVQAAMALGVALHLVSAGLNELSRAEKLPASVRLAEIRDRLTELEVALKTLTVEVDDTIRNAVDADARLRDWQQLAGLTQQQKDSLISEWSRRDRSSSRQNLLLFIAGVAAGVLTNVFIK
jgi:hypothetical protein